MFGASRHATIRDDVMRGVIIVLAVIGLCFVGVMLWPTFPPRSDPGTFEPNAPQWLEGWLPNPPAALFRSKPPSVLAKGQQWSGKFFAEDGKLGVVRFRLVSGPELKITAKEDGQKDQVLCVLPNEEVLPCPKVRMNGKGNIVVYEHDADVRLEATSGDIVFTVNE